MVMMTMMTMIHIIDDGGGVADDDGDGGCAGDDGGDGDDRDSDGRGGGGEDKAYLRITGTEYFREPGGGPLHTTKAGVCIENKSPKNAFCVSELLLKHIKGTHCTSRRSRRWCQARHACLRGKGSGIGLLATLQKTSLHWGSRLQLRKKVTLPRRCQPLAASHPKEHGKTVPTKDLGVWVSGLGFDHAGHYPQIPSTNAPFQVLNVWAFKIRTGFWADL